MDLHVDHLAAASAHQLDHLADVVGRDLDRHLLDRLLEPVRAVAEQDARAAHGELVALAAHRLDEDAEVEHAATADLHAVGAVGRQHLERDVGLAGAIEAVLHVARRDELALGAGEGRVVDAELHRERRRLDGHGLRRNGVLGVGERVADLDAVHARDRRSGRPR